MQLVFLPKAVLDLEAIGDYIARDNPRRAISFVRELRTVCRKIIQAPQAYRSRPELGKGLRSYAHGNYVIIFCEKPGLLQIIRILHSAMDIGAQFR